MLKILCWVYREIIQTFSREQSKNTSTFSRHQMLWLALALYSQSIQSLLQWLGISWSVSRSWWFHTVLVSNVLQYLNLIIFWAELNDGDMSVFFLWDFRTDRGPHGAHVCLFQALSERFNGEISGDLVANSCFFPDEYFTCSSQCLSCGWVASSSFLQKKNPKLFWTSSWLYDRWLAGLAAGTAWTTWVKDSLMRQSTAVGILSSTIIAFTPVR